MVLARELLLIITFFVVVVVYPASTEDYVCQYVPGLYQKTTENASPCMESQLTDDSRLKLLEAFNEFRSNTSRGLKDGTEFGYTNVFAMRYHWLCEYFAAYFINNKMVNDKISVNDIAQILSNVKQAYDGVSSYGSLSDVDEKSANVTSEDHFGVHEMQLNVGTQSEFIRAYITRISQIADPYLRQNCTGPAETLFPGTTHFGCSIRFYNTSSSRKRQQGQILNRLTCVFLTFKEALINDTFRLYHHGYMSDVTCSEAQPTGTFLPDFNLCFDTKYSKESADNDVPCQFYYNIPAEKLPAVMKKCNGENPETNERFLVPPDGYTNAKILYSDTEIDFDFGNKPQTDGALKLHFVPIYLIVSTACIQKFYF